MSEEFAAGGGVIEGCAVDRDESSFDEVVLSFQFVDFRCQLCLARACRSGDENWVGGGENESFKFVDGLVVLLVLGLDAVLQECEPSRERSLMRLARAVLLVRPMSMIFSSPSGLSL